MAHNNIEFVRNKNQKGSKANAAITTKSHKKDKTLFYLHTTSNKTEIQTHKMNEYDATKKLKCTQTSSQAHAHSVCYAPTMSK